ncbi:MAG: two-component sensor histidine kinase, partial [Myxococcaceae bacterium]|nr:two-component sensor histidine kinase [Myxococcaceae bacterium]
PGIPPDVQARIFEPFFTTREKGTGLGLPLARKLVEANGGALAVSSRPGRTVFSLSLPRAAPAGGVSGSPRAP